MKVYIWELPDWPAFRWDKNRLAQPLAVAHLKQGRSLGRLERLGFAPRIEAERACTAVLCKAEFWQRHALAPFNERQRTVLNRFLDGFEGKLTARKWAMMARCSPATAQRDIKGLVDLGVLVHDGGGSKNTRYSLAVSERCAAPDRVA